MKKEKIAGIVLAVVNIVLIVVGIVLYLGTDRKEPSFEFQAMDIIYEEGMDTSRLLEGISAYDNEDGDITHKIVIEKLIENRELNSVVVIYGVSDNAGNVAKCSREFTAIFREEQEGEIPEEEMEVQDGWLMQSGFWTGLEGNDTAEDGGEEDKHGETHAEDERAEDLSARNETGEEEDDRNQPEDNAGQEAAEGSAANGDNEVDDQAADEGSAEGQQERSIRARNTPDPEAPVLALKVGEVKTSVGAGPAWVEIIGTLSDDKDGYETLFNNLEVSKYDKNQPGTYEVTVSTKDSDGNRSQTVPLTIIVK